MLKEFKKQFFRLPPTISETYELVTGIFQPSGARPRQGHRAKKQHHQTQHHRLHGRSRRMYAGRTGPGTAHQHSDGHQARRRARAREDHQRQGQNRNERRTAPECLRTGQFGDLLRRRRDQPRPDGNGNHRPAEQPHHHTPLRRLRARGHRRVPQPHPPGNREIPLHLRRRPFETAGRGNLHRRPGKSGNGPQLQIFHGESAVTLRDDRILHRPSGADRERHARQMLRRIFERMHRQREEYHLPEPGTRRSDRDHCRR